MAREKLSGWLLVLVLTVLASAADAQGGQGKGKGKGQGRARNQQQSTWEVPRGKGEKGEKLPMPSLPGFDAPAKGAKKKAPVGPRPKQKPPPPKPEAPQPPDPMKEADEVTGAADHRSQVEQAERQFLREHFRLCDLDASGWLSLREAELALSLDRNAFRRMDRDQDGRLDANEFAAQGELLLARLGAAPVKAKGAEPVDPPVEAQAEPAPEPEPAEPGPAEQEVVAAPPARSELDALPVRPPDLLGRYDLDRSAGIDASEIETLFAEAGLVLSSELVVAQMDPDDSGQLEGPELVAIAWLVSRDVPEVLRPPPAPPAPAAEPEAVQAAAPAAQAALAVERSLHFKRLDPGRDGFIDEGDLRALQSPSRLDLRFRALLSAVDQDGDGRLSEAEFRASMGADRR